MMSLAPVLPGFVYDEEKKKYFKITNGHTEETSSKYHNNSVQKERRRASFFNKLERPQKRRNADQSAGKMKKGDFNRIQRALVLYRAAQRTVFDTALLKLATSLELQYPTTSKVEMISINFKYLGEHEKASSLPIVHVNIISSRFENYQILLTQDTRMAYYFSRTPHKDFFHTDEDISIANTQFLDEVFTFRQDYDTIERENGTAIQNTTFSTNTVTYGSENCLLTFSSCFFKNLESSYSIALLSGYNLEDSSIIRFSPNLLNGDGLPTYIANKISRLFGYQKFFVFGQRVFYKHTAGEYYITASHITDTGTLFVGANNGDIFLIDLDSLINEGKKNHVYTKLLMTGVACIRSKTWIEEGESKGVVVFCGVDGRAMMVSLCPVGIDYKTTVNFEPGGRGKVTNVFFWNDFLILVGLKGITRHAYDGSSYGDMTYLNDNITNQVSCLFQYEFHKNFGEILIVNESNHILRLYDIWSGQNRIIKLTTPKDFVITAMVVIRNRLKIWFYSTKLASTSFMREYELLKHYFDFPYE